MSTRQNEWDNHNLYQVSLSVTVSLSVDQSESEILISRHQQMLLEHQIFCYNYNIVEKV